MRLLQCLLGIGLVFLLTVPAYAKDIKKKDKFTVASACPEEVMATADAEFGDGSGAKTECLSVRDELSVVVAFSASSINPRNGHGQQVLNANNIVRDYTNNYGMEINDEFRVAVIGYGAGARWLLNDAAYDISYHLPTGQAALGNPSDGIINSLMEAGVKFFMCQNTMRGNGWTQDDLIPGVMMVPAGVTAVIDYQQRGYTYLAP